MGEFFTVFLSDYAVYIASSLLLGAVILTIIVRKSRQPTSVTTRCASPSCARCHGEKQIHRTLLGKLRDHVRQTHGVNPEEELSQYLSKNYARVLSTIDSYQRKEEVLQAVYRESGYEDTHTQYMAHVWMMPELKRSPLWSAGDHSLMDKQFSVFENVENFDAIRGEFERVSKSRGDWKENSLPTGSWSTYFLMNQGKWDEEKSTKCPRTRQLLESSGCLMHDTVYGNVFFSVLRPGSVIEAHTSPCNFRLRCHLALSASAGFTLRVGQHTATWETGRLLVFDDSFVHSVEHDASMGQDVGDRAVLIFDVWHPDITHSEQLALKCIFNQV